LLPEDFDLDRREKIYPAQVLQYARERGIHPAIVAGRVRYTKKNYRILTNLVGKGEVRRWLFSQ
jgi:HTH-type transcriptional regulator/antitoxin HigA